MPSQPQKYIIIIGASLLTLPAYHIAKRELNLGTIAFDYNSQAPGMLYADKAVNISTKDINAAVKAAKEVALSYPIAGVFTCGADVEITVSSIAEALDLPAIPVSVAKKCNDKLLMHQHLDNKEFTDKPNYHVVSSQKEAIDAINDIGLPCVIKPINNCGSRGVQRIDDKNFIGQAYKLAASFNAKNEKTVLIEECLVGSKHTIEMIAWQGQWHLLSIIDTHYISPRWPCEVSLNTTLQPPKIQQRMFEFAKHTAQLMGINFNAHKVDVNIDPNGNIKLIELTARLSGGFHCQYISPLAFGSHDIRAAIKLAIGDPLDLTDIQHRYERGAALQAILPPPGQITSIKGIEETKKLPNISQVFICKDIGEQVGPYYNSADRPGFVIAYDENTKSAISKAQEGVDSITISTN